MQTILHHAPTGTKLVLDTVKKRATLPTVLCDTLEDGPHAVCIPGQHLCILLYYLKGHVYRLQFVLREVDILYTELTSSVLDWFLDNATAEMVHGMPWEDLAPGEEPMPPEVLEEFAGIAEEYAATGKRVVAVLHDGPGNDATTTLALRLVRAATDAEREEDETKRKEKLRKEYTKLLLGEDLDLVVNCIIAVGLTADALRRDVNRAVTLEYDPEEDEFIAYADEDFDSTDPDNNAVWHGTVSGALVDIASTIMDALPQEPPHICPECEERAKNCHNN